jgi:ParB/RepB/Spo0J family partition protein
MNAPKAEGLVDAEFANLPLGAIAVSETSSQIRRRRRYTAEVIGEFAKNIAAIGVMEPIIVRRLEALRDLAGYELVAGERRWLASKEAGLTHIPALIREIADEDLALLQLSENMQRVTLEPLEEAEALRDLIAEKGINKDAVAALLGQSRTHVYNRLKLLALKHPAAIEALESGRLDTTKALMIARIPSMKLQLKALEMVADESISMRHAAELLRDKLMVRLDNVPFPIDDATFTHVQARTVPVPGQRPDRDARLHHLRALQQRRSGAERAGHRLVRPQCTRVHGQALPRLQGKDVLRAPHHERARWPGAPILEGAEAKLIRAKAWDTHLYGYIDLDAECTESLPAKLLKKRPDLQDLAGVPSYRQVIGEEALRDAAAVIAVLIDPFTKQPREIITVKDAKKLLNAIDVPFRANVHARTTPPPTGSAADTDSADTPVDFEERRREEEAQKERQEKEMAFRRRIGALIYARWKGKLTRADWEAIAEECLQSGSGNMIANALFDGEINLSELGERDLQALCLLAQHAQSLAWHQSSPADMLALAKRLKIDPAKVKKELKGGETAAQVDKPGAKKAKKKARK